jgi:hypothetical protein
MEHDERLKVWRNLGPHAQLAKLDQRLGPGVGAVKQRARIRQRIAQREAA